MQITAPGDEGGAARSFGSQYRKSKENQTGERDGDRVLAEAAVGTVGARAGGDELRAPAGVAVDLDAVGLGALDDAGEDRTVLVQRAHAAVGQVRLAPDEGSRSGEAQQKVSNGRRGGRGGVRAHDANVVTPEAGAPPSKRARW